MHVEVVLMSHQKILWEDVQVVVTPAVPKIDPSPYFVLRNISKVESDIHYNTRVSNGIDAP